MDSVYSCDHVIFSVWLKFLILVLQCQRSFLSLAEKGLFVRSFRNYVLILACLTKDRYRRLLFFIFSETGSKYPFQRYIFFVYCATSNFVAISLFLFGIKLLSRCFLIEKSVLLLLECSQHPSSFLV